jgi:acetolactate synthase I/II/III large subunit
MPPKKRTGGQVIVEALEKAGIRHCFGVPGESYMGLLDAFIDSPIEFVSCRHEGGASFMASGYSRVSGEIGLCMGTRAVGTANMAIGVHNAQQDSTPLIAIAGGVNRAFIGREAFQEVDLVAAMKPFTKLAVEVPSADQAPEIMARGIHAATSGRPGAVFVVVPQDVCDETTTEPTRPVTATALPVPDPAAVTAVLDALTSARRPLLFAGGGVSRSSEAVARLVEFAEAAEIPVMTDWRHHDGFPNEHRLFLGSAGIGAAPVVWERLGEADVVLVLGNRLQENTTAGYRFPYPGSRLFHVDLDPAVMVNHRSPELAIQADVTAMLAALAEGLPRPAPSAAERREVNRADRARFEASGALPDTEPAPGEGISYPQMFDCLAKRLGPETVVTTDAGNFYGWLARYVRFSRPRTYIGPASGAMGYGLPAAIGASFAQPEASDQRTPVISLSGDGGFLMTVAEVETAVRHERHVVALVCDNSRHGTIRMHQERAHPGRVIGTELGTTDLSAVARGLGAAGFLVDDVAGFDDALHQAMATPGPTVIHARMDRGQLSVEARLP